MRTLALTLFLLAPAALAEPGPVCRVARPLEGQRLLRRLSLDLRGTLPTHDEQLLQSGKAEVPAATVEAMLASEGFVQVMRRHHANLLWPNLDAVDVAPPTFALLESEVAPGVKVWWSPVRSLYTRTVTRTFVPCRGVPATFDAQGRPVTVPLVEGGQTTAVQEGYVEVEPYWAPGTRVKVCAFEASTAAEAPTCAAEDTASRPYLKTTCDQFAAYGQAVGVDVRARPSACESAFAILTAGCGCGPNLRHCSTAETGAAVRASMLEQMLRLVDSVVREDRPSTDILRAADLDINGPLAHHLAYQARASFDVFGELDETAPLPARVSYVDPTWQPLPRSGRHSGVLTTAGYLLKFQSNRARAHRFYAAFECSAFVPAGPLPPPTAPCSKREDLTKRCGCDACHVALEPMAAHWGRFAEYGHTPLGDARYPKDGRASVCSGFRDMDQLFRCFRQYQVTAVGDELPFQGFLKPYVFRTPAEAQAVEAGPGRLVDESVASGRLGRCAVRRMWTQFLHREPTADEERDILPGLQRDFEADGHRLRGLVRALVSLPAYRRLP